jgi:hypothetical protein
VLRCPFNYKAQRSGWNIAFQDTERLNFDRDFLSGVSGMEMGRIVIIEKHGDDDAVKPTDFGHVFLGLDR